MPRRATIAICLLIAAAACDARSQQADQWTPAPTTSTSPFIVGTNIRIWSGEGRKRDPGLARLLDTIADDGYSSIRLEWGLAAKETIPDAAEVPELFARTPAIRPLVTLTGGGSGRFATGMPISAKDVSDFDGFAMQSANAFGRSPIFEVWNEWNLPTHLRPAGEIAPYVRLARKAYATVKAANQDAIVLVGAVGNDIGSGPFRPDRLSWLDAAISLGLLEKADGLSVHFYNNCGRYRSASLADMLWRIEQIHAMILKKTGANQPIYVTEAGWPTSATPASSCGYPPGESVTQAARFLLAASAISYIKGVWLYEYIDRPRVSGLEGHFGVKSGDGRSKASNCDLARVLTIIRSSKRRSLEVVAGIYHFRATDGRNEWDIYWSESSRVDPQASLQAQGGTKLCATGQSPQHPNIDGNPLIVTR